MGTMASQIASLTIIYSTVYSGADQRKHQSSASLAFVRGIHRSPHKWLITRKKFPFHDVIMDRSKVVSNRDNDRAPKHLVAMKRTCTRRYNTKGNAGNMVQYYRLQVYIIDSIDNTDYCKRILYEALYRQRSSQEFELTKDKSLLNVTWINIRWYCLKHDDDESWTWLEMEHKKRQPLNGLWYRIDITHSNITLYCAMHGSINTLSISTILISYIYIYEYQIHYLNINRIYCIYVTPRGHGKIIKCSKWNRTMIIYSSLDGLLPHTA